MKTLMIMMLAIGTLSFETAYASATSKLPYDRLTALKDENPVIYDNTHEILNVVVSDNTKVDSKSMDTILIDLSQEEITGSFPGGSKDCIMQQVPYPEFARAMQIEGGVAVRFYFDGSGKIHVLDSNSNSPELEQYVLARLSNLQLKNCVVDINKDYYLRFIFRLF